MFSKCYDGSRVSCMVQLADCGLSVAKNRGWFSDYVPYESTLGSLHTPGIQLKVEGIGTVELPTKRKLNGSGAGSHSTLKLIEVLHVPTAICNIIGMPRHDEYDEVQFSRGIFGTDGRKIACFDRSRPLFQIKLSGPPVGPEVGPPALQNGEHYLISVQWSSVEQQRWEAYRTSVASSQTAYTQEEKAWLKKNYGGELQFLRAYGLSIYDEEEREEGRSILRGLMQADD